MFAYYILYYAPSRSRLIMCGMLSENLGMVNERKQLNYNKSIKFVNTEVRDICCSNAINKFENNFIPDKGRSVSGVGTAFPHLIF